MFGVMSIMFKIGQKDGCLWRCLEMSKHLQAPAVPCKHVYVDNRSLCQVNWCAGELKAPWTLEPTRVLVRKTTLECDEETNELVPVRKTKSESTTRMVAFSV